MNEEQANKTLEFLKNAAVDTGAMAHLKFACEIDSAIHTLCLVRNGLDKRHPKFNARYTFLEGAIKVMKDEGQRHFDIGTDYVKARQNAPAERNSVRPVHGEEQHVQLQGNSGNVGDNSKPS